MPGLGQKRNRFFIRPLGLACMSAIRSKFIRAKATSRGRKTTRTHTHGGFKNLQNRSRRRQSAHFSSIIGVLAPSAVGGYDFLKPPWAPGQKTAVTRTHVNRRKMTVKVK